MSAETGYVQKSNLNEIKNKLKRQEVYKRSLEEKAKEKKLLKQKRKREEEEAKAQGIERPKKTPKTIENTRKPDETFVKAEDEEVVGDDAIDEFASYYENQVKPKILITTSNRAKGDAFDLVRELLHVFPNSFFYSRKGFEIKKIVKAAIEKEFTDVMILHEDNAETNSMMLVHLPNGPTAHFKLSSIKMPKEIRDHAAATRHRPEVILNHFDTRLGHRLGRMIGALFDQQPNFKGRRVVTFHNQRDYIFFRQHRYIFDDAKTARLQECGPRFTLKLKYLQHGLPDTKHGEYEFIRKKEIGNGRKDFFL